MFCRLSARTLNDMKFARPLSEIEVIEPRAHGPLGKLAAGAVLAAVTLLGGGIAMAGVASASTLHPSVPPALRPAQVAARDGLVANRLNAIRASFSLATGQATTSYTAEVTKAVMSNEDPQFAAATRGVVAEGSLWGVVPGASGSPASSALEIVNGWVYHDGLGGLGTSNVERGLHISLRCRMRGSPSERLDDVTDTGSQALHRRDDEKREL
jgi:hypothetical protein